ncbi:DUF421 domain-containing protein [Rubinisphaera margarita]|uniref:DUF421 domain-containing protein n=1 Tax=Rubinisphaera margarita TaxID=2909586 RepID=UPI001EE8BF0A|nr:YetF domain-containing protein [Rubinisphaera margarita]MCG6157433.1 DUF421 domain-containing protein [Rubinisphaera margarita]
MDHSAWFESWDSLFKITVSTVFGYFMLILFVRTAGKRSTSKMNNFDWIVTVAVGSVLASMAVLKDVTVADGLLAMALLLGLQYVLTISTSRWEWARRLFLAAPSVLFSDGEFDHVAMRKERVSRDEILQTIRDKGIASLDDVRMVTLEANAELSVVSRESGPADSEPWPQPKD